MIPVTIHLPDDIAAQYQSDELARCVLENFAVQEYVQGRLTLLQLRQLLGLESRYAAHGLLKKHGVPFYPYEEDQKDMATLDRQRWGSRLFQTRRNLSTLFSLTNSPSCPS